MKIKLFSAIVISLIFFSILRISVKSSELSVNRFQLPYEVLSIETNNKNILINGWGFINLNQHFLDESTHDIFIEFQSRTHQFTQKTTLQSIDMTSLMEYRGSPMCESKEYFKLSSICNYYYKNVGFEIFVPFSSFKENETYQAMLVVHAKQTNTTYKTKLFFPIKNPITKLVDDYLFSVDSSLNATQLIVNHSNVVVRNGPFTSYPIYRIGYSCSLTYKNQLFYRENSMFTSIVDKIILNNLTYYRINGDLDRCVNHRMRVKEGNTIQPMYIASSFIEYGGQMLTISSQLINDAPVLSITHPTIYEDETFDYLLFVSAFDKQEKDITNKIVVKSNNFVQKVGRYSLVLYVQDKHGAYDQRTMNVTVISPKNTPPIIFAQDRSIKQYENYNAMDGVVASDNEDGNLTSSITLVNQVSTDYLGDFTQCYEVYDSAKAKASKCVTISIVERDKVSSHRFVHDEFLQEIHQSWLEFFYVFKNELINKNPLYSTKR